jgi:dolichyl-phosphate-mannose-protein mannosyltransferase
LIGLSAFVGGLALLLVTLGAVLGAAALIVRRRLPRLSGVSMVLGWALISTAGVIGVHLIPGIFGLLSRFTVPLVALIALGLAALAPAARAAAHDDEPAAAGAQPHWSWVLAIGGLAVFCAYAIARVKATGALAPSDTDALSFHLPSVVQWIQTGTLWTITDYLPQQAHGAYPNNGDAVLLALALPFHSDLLVRWAMLPYLALVTLGTYGIARELRAPLPTALLSAVALTAVPAVVYPALFNVQTDTLMLATFAAGIYFLLRHRRTESRADLVLAGLGLGIAFGTKWYGVSTVAGVIVVWAAAWLLCGRGFARVARETLLLTALVLAAGGFWLLRNLVQTGNPLFPLKVAPLGVTIFDAPRDVLRQLAGFRIADYLGAPHILGHYVAPALWRTLGLSTVLLVVAALAIGAVAAIRLLRRRAAADDGTLAALAASVLVLAALYVITPYTALGAHNQPLQVDANTRYLIPAIVPAAGLAAAAATFLNRWRWLIELALFAGIVESVRRAFGLHVSGTVAIVGLLVVLAASVATSAWRPRRPAVAVGGVIVAIVALAIVQRHRFDDRRYRSDQAVAWIVEHAASGHRIGLAGSWSNYLSPILPAFGPRFANTVTYVGPTIRHMLQQYGSEQQFLAALRRGRYDLLVVGRGASPPQRAPEESWAIAAGYRLLAQSPRLTLLRAS